MADAEREYQKRRKLAVQAGVSNSSTLALPKDGVWALGYPAQRRELFLMEGTSASGTAVDAKMPWQELLPLRGKLPNVLRKKAKLLTNDIVRNIIAGVGFDPRNPNRPTRVGRVIILSDADDDGRHIRCLLIAFLYTVMPELIIQGKVSLMDAPLFEAMDSRGNKVSGDSITEMERRYGNLTQVNRMKGWGGCDVPLLRSIAFDPATRRELVLLPPTEAEAKQFRLLLGDDPSARKALLGGNTLGGKQNGRCDPDDNRRDGPRKPRAKSKNRAQHA